MQKNLLQKTLYEVYQKRQGLGYGLFENNDMLIISWENPALAFFNKVHCHSFSPQMYDLLCEKYGKTGISIASDHPVENVENLEFEGISTSMLLETSQTFEENPNFEIKAVRNTKDVKIFVSIAAEVFNIAQNQTDLEEALNLDFKLDFCHRYIGFKDGVPAGVVEFIEGSEAVFICWVAVKENFRRQGLCYAMFAHAINFELSKGYHRFILISTKAGKSVYASLGFKDYALRYNYYMKAQTTEKEK